MQTTYAFLKLTSAIIDSQQKSDVVSSDTQQFAENFFCRTGITSAAKAASDFKTLTARLEAAPFQSRPLQSRTCNRVLQQTVRAPTARSAAWLINHLLREANL
ncbi:MAG: hypothetical protein DMG77_04810 [Acidobacteria bacterium]|nr:MAG: hypothetical protein DMG77_04810 [Acidobacteriota bacterium]